MQYYRKFFIDSRDNIKSTWKKLKQLLGQSYKRGNLTTSLNVGDWEIFDEKEMANMFDEYFTTVAGELGSQIAVLDKCPLQYVDKNIVSSFYMLPAMYNECNDIVLNLRNTKHNHDIILVIIFKKVAHVIPEPYCSRRSKPL